jgi:hypothetical protein
MTKPTRRDPATPSGRLTLWMSPWLWSVAGLLLGGLVVLGYIAGAIGGLWPWAPGALEPHSAEPHRQPLPNAGPAVAGDCRPLAVPLHRNGETQTVHGLICLQDNGTWALAEPQAPAIAPKTGE